MSYWTWCWSDGMVRVLILIILEVTLWGAKNSTIKNQVVDVLILIILEVTLWVKSVRDFNADEIKS